MRSPIFLAVAAIVFPSCLTPTELRPLPDRWIGDLEAVAAKHPLEPGQNFRIDELCRSASSSLHLVQLSGALKLHLHRRHEETACLLRGRGVMTIAGEETKIGPGWSMRIPAGFVHGFRGDDGETCLVLVSFAPPIDRDGDGEDREIVE